MDLPAELGLVVFDLDFTFWDAGGVWCDCLTRPFSKNNGGVFDAVGRRVKLYDAVDPTVSLLEDAGVKMALASRTDQPAWARELIGLLDYGDRWDYEEIYPSSKVRHFNALKERSGLEFSEMLFFDDEMRNIEEVGELGVRVVHVRNGFSESDFRRGLELF
ncbi:MAG: magnesium-dependent phosphatase-1 [Verrucomicrobiota bacterium]